MTLDSAKATKPARALNEVTIAPIEAHYHYTRKAVLLGQVVLTSLSLPNVRLIASLDE